MGFALLPVVQQGGVFGEGSGAPQRIDTKAEEGFNGHRERLWSIVKRTTTVFYYPQNHLLLNSCDALPSHLPSYLRSP